MTPQRFERMQKVLDCRQKDITIILENIEDPHNIAAVLRTCDSVGIQDIYVINTLDRGGVKHYSTKSSSSANKWVNVHHFNDISTCVKEVKSRYKRILCAHLDAKTLPLYSLDLTQSIAIVFGNEAKGISEDLLCECDGSFIIPQVGMIQSLNISVACAVTLYEAFRQKQIKGDYEVPQLSFEEKNHIFNQWRV